jgi:hypothetical protein
MYWFHCIFLDHRKQKSSFGRQSQELQSEDWVVNDATEVQRVYPPTTIEDRGRIAR